MGYFDELELGSAKRLHDAVEANADASRSGAQQAMSRFASGELRLILEEFAITAATLCDPATSEGLTLIRTPVWALGRLEHLYWQHDRFGCDSDDLRGWDFYIDRSVRLFVRKPDYSPEWIPGRVDALMAEGCLGLLRPIADSTVEFDEAAARDRILAVCGTQLRAFAGGRGPHWLK